MAKRQWLITGHTKYNIVPRDSAYLSNTDGIITNNEKQLLENSSQTYDIEQYYMAHWKCNITYLPFFGGSSGTHDYAHDQHHDSWFFGEVEPEPRCHVGLDIGTVEEEASIG